MSWRTYRLDECARIVGGATPSTEVNAYWDDGTIPWVTPKDLSELHTQFIANTPRKISPAGLASCASELLPAGSVLFSSRAPIGHVAINSVPMATNQGFKSFVPDPSKLHSGYLYWWLKANKARLQGLGNGATFKEVSKTVVARIEIPLPPLSEQRRIAAILDQADALRRKRREAVNRAGVLTQAIFRSMFGDWSEGSGRVPRVKLGEKLCFLTSGSRGWARYYSEKGGLFLRIQNVRRDELDLSDVAHVEAPDSAEARRTRVEAGDVLMSITADLGRTAVVPATIAGAYINQHLAILRTDKIEPRFLSAALASPEGQRAIQGRNREAVKAGLNFDDIRSLEIPDADRDAQKAFAAAATAVDRIKSEYSCHSKHLDTLFSSLQHRTFSVGQVRGSTGNLTPPKLAAE